MQPPDTGQSGDKYRQERRRFFEREIVCLMSRLYGTALRLTRNPDDAEDLVAETVAKAWAKLDSLQNIDHFEGWLFRILTNTFVSTWRRQRLMHKVEASMGATIPLDTGGNDSLPYHAPLHQPLVLWRATPEGRFMHELLREELRQAVDTLPEAYRIVVVLVEVRGHTHQEVMELLDIPLGTVRSRLSRGRANLQKMLG